MTNDKLFLSGIVGGYAFASLFDIPSSSAVFVKRIDMTTGHLSYYLAAAKSRLGDSSIDKFSLVGLYKDSGTSVTA